MYNFCKQTQVDAFNQNRLQLPTVCFLNKPKSFSERHCACVIAVFLFFHTRILLDLITCLIPKRHSTFKVSWTALPVWVQNDEGCLISWCDSFLSVNQPEGVPGWPNSLLEHAMNDGKVHVITASSSESLLIHATLRLHWLSNESVVAPRSDLSWSQKGWCPGLCIIRLSITVLTWL